jgi:hypothetical protein
MMVQWRKKGLKARNNAPQGKALGAWSQDKQKN